MVPMCCLRCISLRISTHKKRGDTLNLQISLRDPKQLLTSIPTPGGPGGAVILFGEWQPLAVPFGDIMIIMGIIYHYRSL